MCPLVNISLQKQEEGATAGTASYPAISQVKKFSIIIDEFTREALNPTNAYVLYTAASNDGNGTATIAASNRLLLTTDSSAIGDDESVRVSGLAFSRVPVSTQIDARNTLKFTIVLSLGETADTEGFIGIDDSAAALTALPTTGRFMGLLWDKSADNNYQLTSRNNTTTVTTDTGIALQTQTVKVIITWTGSNDAILEFMDDPNSEVADSTQTVTAFGLGSGLLHFFVQTEATAAKTLNIREYRVEGS